MVEELRGNKPEAPVVKDEDRAHPVASLRRPSLSAIVAAFAAGDYGPSRGVPGVDAIGESTVHHVDRYVADYGETLTELPEDAWNTSVMGDYWDVLVDLWTEESGPSDMVLHAQVFEYGAGYRFQVYLVYVP